MSVWISRWKIAQQLVKNKNNFWQNAINIQTAVIITKNNSPKMMSHNCHNVQFKTKILLDIWKQMPRLNSPFHQTKGQGWNSKSLQRIKSIFLSTCTAGGMAFTTVKLIYTLFMTKHNLIHQNIYILWGNMYRNMPGLFPEQTLYQMTKPGFNRIMQSDWLGETYLKSPIFVTSKTENLTQWNSYFIHCSRTRSKASDII